MWTPHELERLRILAERHRTSRGIGWKTLIVEWENQRRPNDPIRTIPAMQKALRGLAPRREQAASMRNEAAATQEMEITPNEAEVEYEEMDAQPSTPKPERGSENGRRYGHLLWAEPNDELKAAMAAMFDDFYKRAIKSLDRQPIRRPRKEISKVLLQVGDEILRGKLNAKRIPHDKAITAVNAAVYAIAKTITTLVNDHEMEKAGKNQQRKREAEKQRDTLISFVSALANELTRRQIADRNPPSEKYKSVARLYGVSKTIELQRLLQKLKDELQLVKQEIGKIDDALRRCKERRLGYPSVAREPRDLNVETPVEEIREYWRGIVGEPEEFTPSPELVDWARREGRAPDRTYSNTSDETWKDIFSRVKPWKATGPDGIQGFWWKHLPEAKQRLRQWCEAATRNPRKAVPKWMCRGRIVLIPKVKTGPNGPGDFRPIACLNTCYKILTAMMARQIHQCVKDRFPMEQVAMRKGIWGCTHAHILDQTMCKDAQRRNKELHMLWVDMTKAFDSISHKALKWILAKLGVTPCIRTLLSELMSKQTVRYCGYQGQKMVKSKPLEIKRGIMQGDTLSPLLFCIAIMPISDWIRTYIAPYRTATGAGKGCNGPMMAGHIFYMDDLKVYTTTYENLVKAKDGIHRVARQIGLRMNPAKCAMKSLNSTDLREGRSGMDEIPILGTSSLYKYLGAEQNTFINMEQLWRRVEEHAKASARRLMSSNLVVRQKVNGYNQIVIPKLKYAISCIIFGTGKMCEMRKKTRNFDAYVRKLLEQTKLRFGHSCAARLYVSKDEGGLGLKSVEEEMEHTIVYTWCYLTSRPEFKIPCMLADSLRASNKRSIISDFNAVLKDNRLEKEIIRLDHNNVMVRSRIYRSVKTAARAISTAIHERWACTHKATWLEREVASRVLSVNLENNQPFVCYEDSFLWIKKGWLSAEVLRNAWAAQEASLATKASASGTSMWLQTNQLCRMRCQAKETAEHIVSVCSHWRTNIMVERHDDVARVLYSSLKKKYKLWGVISNTREPHIIETDEVVIHWNEPIQTSGIIKHNRPDIIVRDKKSKVIWIIEISVSWFTRLLTQERRKIYKYSLNSNLPENTAVEDFFPGPNLKAELQRDYKMRVEMIPIVIGACGECTPNLRKHVRMLNLPDTTDYIIEKMERCAVLGTNRLIKCHLSNLDNLFQEE